ncbi:MAG: phosphopantothenoylcysteine decarboxylase [Planctomycetes bacterium]|nr:phosphopantothenoylcysteine decarboxylase [Planctomycetota bacterium]
MAVKVKGTMKVKGPVDLRGAITLITAGPTWEYIDDVRFLGNPSTGLMGMELARAAQRLGASVTVVCGPTHLQPPPGVAFVPVVSAQEMLEAVSERFDRAHVFIASAAVSDYRPAERVRGKIKKSDHDMTLKLVRNPDVLRSMGQRRRDDQVMVGFSLEAANEVEYAKGKMTDKHCDLMVVNTPLHFGDTKEFVRILSPAGLVAELPPSTKAQVADAIVDLAARLYMGQKIPPLQKFEGKTSTRKRPAAEEGGAKT